MAKDVIQLHFPTAGLVRRMSYQDGQSAFSTSAAMNVWPDDAILERERGGSRAGTELVGSPSASAINGMSDVAYAPGGVYTNKVVVTAGGSLYYYNGTSFSSGGSGLGTIRNLCFADFRQKLYITGQSAIKIFDPATNSTASISESEGTAPTGCTLCAICFNRLFVAGDPSDPSNWYASKFDDPLDWDYAPDPITPQQAVAGNNSNQGRLGEPIRALIPHSQSCLLFGCNTSMWALTGDPMAGGELSPVSKVGIHSAQSWCYDTDGWLYFLSPNDGVYIMEPGCGSTARSISRERIPLELKDISRTACTVSMAYDARYRGVILCVKKDSGTSTHWFIDIRQARGGDNVQGSIAFWPMQFTSLNPTACWSVRDAISTGDDSTMWMGTADGKVIRFNRTVKNDNGNAFDSYVDIGPFPLASLGRTGLLQELQVTIAASSAPVRCAVRVGNSGEEAFNASEFATVTFATAGYNMKWHPRARGAMCIVRFGNDYVNDIADDDTAWAFEGAYAKRIDAGERRV